MRTRKLSPSSYSGRGVNQLIVRKFRTHGDMPQLLQTSSSPWFNYAQGQLYILSVTYEEANSYKELHYLYYLLSLSTGYKYTQLVAIIHSY